MRIALYLNNLDEEYQLALYRSVSVRARELGLDLLCIQQERLAEEHFSLKLFPSHKFISVDGIILLSSVLTEQSTFTFGEKIKSIFGNIPVISMSTHINGLPSLIIKTQNSMEALMEHLLTVHHYEHFLYLGGPEGHQDNIVRESVFNRSIEKARKLNPSVTADCIHAGFNRFIGMVAVEQYIEQHSNAPVDVIVSANDTMAIGALRAIQTQHDERWASCAVTGFDDIPGARLEQPALTTIRQPTGDMGCLAVETMLKLLFHEKIDDLIKIDSSLIIRNSCGCTVQEVTDEQNQSSKHEMLDYITNIQRERIKAEQVQQHGSYFSSTLNGVSTVYDIIDNLKSFLGNIGIQTFYFILFPPNTKTIPDKAQLIYMKNSKEELVFTPPRAISLKDFFYSELFNAKTGPSNLVMRYLNAGKEQIGMIVYEAEDIVHPQMCSIAILIGNTISRIRFLQKEKDHSKELEKEVARRTKEIVDTNKKLAEESQRRIMVEAEVLKISEQERMRFSMDLHDDICQRLAGISMMCQGMSAMQPDLQELSTLIDETLRRPRQYAHDSFPMELDSLGMNEAIGNLCNTVQMQSEKKLIVSYSWKAQEPLPLDRAQKINIYRIIQEALHNTVKHAAASKVTVSILQKNENLTITIKDNGKGDALLSKDPTLIEANAPNATASKKSAGIGLRSMYYRADQIGATCSIHSKVGVGTTVSLVIPLSSKQ